MENDIQESSSLNIEAASNQIASDLFGSKIEEKEESDYEGEENGIQDETSETDEIKDETDEADSGRGEKEVPEIETTNIVDKRAAPASWSKEMHQHFEKLPKDVQEYIELREKQMADGISGAKEDLYFGREMKGAITPYMHIIQSQGLTPVKAVQSLMNVHVALSNSSPDQKLDYLKKIANSYGIDFNGIQRAAQQVAEQRSQLPPEIQTVVDRLNSVETMYQNSQLQAQQAVQEKTRSEVDSFASDPANRYFDDVADEVVAFVQAGHDLKDAYEKAVWANPVTRQKEMARLQTEADAGRLKKQKEDADRAKKASSVNVRSRDTRKAPTELTGTMEDTMRDTLKKIKSRG